MATPVLVNSRSPIPVQADRMARIEDRIAQLDKQISTGEKFTEPAQDPAGANRAAALVRMTGRLDAEQRVIDRASSRLALAETGIESASEALLRARDLALSAANGSMDAESRQIIAHEIAILKSQLIDAANSRDDSGRFLFGGADNAQPPYAADPDGGVVRWQGFGGTAGAEAAGVVTAAPPGGPQLFGDEATGAFALLDQLTAALMEPENEARNLALASAIEGLDHANDRLILGQALIGAGGARLQVESNRIASAKLDVARGIADVRGVDLTAAFVEMQSLQMTLNASQLSFSRLFDGTLFDRLG
ncbi:MAG: flagellin [Sphingomonadaceae bacterium]